VYGVLEANAMLINTYYYYYYYYTATEDHVPYGITQCYLPPKKFHFLQYIYEQDYF